MTVSENQKKIAIKYLKKLKVKGKVIEDFEENENVYILNGTYFENLKRDDILYTIIKEIKKEGSLVYGVVFANTYLGCMINFLTVSPYPEDWHLTVKELRPRRYRVYAYVWNTDAPELSEFGSIIVEEKDGYLERVI